MSMDFQPLRHWTTAQLADLDDAVGQVLASWCEAWGLNAGLVEARSRAAVDDADGSVSSWEAMLPNAVAEQQLWAAGLPTTTALMALMFEERAPIAQAAPIAKQLAEIARAELSERLRGLGAPTAKAAIGYATTVPPVAHDRRWSGAVVARCAMPFGALVLHFGPLAAAARMRPAAPTKAQAQTPLVPLREVLDTRRLPLRVEFTEVELDVGALQALAVGDVVLLPHALAQPLKAQVGGTGLRCSAYLGARDGMRAIELVALDATL
jgi:hypothetical protein